MKKVLAAALAVTMIIGLQAPAVFTEDPAVQGTEETRMGFDETIESLYARSQEISDEEVMETAQEMTSDLGGAEKVLGTEAGEVVKCLDLFEEAKAAYILGTSTDAGAFAAEWEEEAAYAGKFFSDEQTLCSMVPRYRVDAYELTDNRLSLDLYEWMTAGYTEGDSKEINVTAYGFTFTAELSKESGTWTVVSVSGSDANSKWMQTEAEQAAEEQAQLAQEQKQGLMEQAARDFAGIRAYAAGTDTTTTTTTTTETILPYTYSREKAVAYGDKWALKRNTSVYKDYSKVGGDCANFVSQCLCAGGMPVSGTSFYDGWHKDSLSWINVMAHIKHFKNYGIFYLATKENTLKGNPVYFDWNGDGTWDHATLCVGKNSAGTPIIDSHTADLYHGTWSYSSAKKISTIQLYDTSKLALKATASDTIPATTTVNEAGEEVKVGWAKENGKWLYYENNVPAKGWITVDGKKYYLNDDGIMQTGWVKYEGKWYYLHSSGAMATGWKKKNGKWYYLDETTGIMQTGWVKVKNKWYYMSSSGVMKTGWIKVKGAKYYLKSSGAMVTGRYKIKGKWYTFSKNGKLKK